MLKSHLDMHTRTAQELFERGSLDPETRSAMNACVSAVYVLRAIYESLEEEEKMVTYEDTWPPYDNYS